MRYKYKDSKAKTIDKLNEDYDKQIDLAPTIRLWQRSFGEKLEALEKQIKELQDDGPYRTKCPRNAPPDKQKDEDRWSCPVHGMATVMSDGHGNAICFKIVGGEICGKLCTALERVLDELS